MVVPVGTAHPRAKRPLHGPVAAIRRRSGAWLAVFLTGALALLLIAVLSGALKAALPNAVASKIGFNSEGYFYALVMIPWIYFMVQRIAAKHLLPIAGVLGAIWLAIGIWMLASSMPSAIKTLNEPALALGVLIPYTAIRRPLPSWVSGSLVGGVLVVMGLGMWKARPLDGQAMDSLNWVISLGEAVGLVLLTVVALDIVETWILAPGSRRVSELRTVSFYTFLICTPVVVSLLGQDDRIGNDGLGMTLNYLGRIAESFVGLLILCFAFVLIRTVERRYPHGVS